MRTGSSVKPKGRTESPSDRLSERMLRPALLCLLLLLTGIGVALAVQDSSSLAEPHQPTANNALSATALDRLWQELGGADARVAYQSLWALVAAPDSAVPFLDEHLKTISAPDLKRLDGL